MYLNIRLEPSNMKILPPKATIGEATILMD